MRPRPEARPAQLAPHEEDGDAAARKDEVHCLGNPEPAMDKHHEEDECRDRAGDNKRKIWRTLPGSLAFGMDLSVKHEHEQERDDDIDPRRLERDGDAAGESGRDQPTGASVIAVAKEKRDRERRKKKVVPGGH